MTIPSLSSDPPPAPAAPLDREPDAPLDAPAAVGGWLNGHFVVMLAATAVMAAAGTAVPLGIAAAASFAYLCWRGRRLLAPGARCAGAANLVTASRLALIVVAALSMGVVSGVLVVTVLTINGFLDFVDGWLARRLGQTSAFGALFDREVDAVFVLVAYSYFYVTQGIGLWILLPGAAPYVYRAAMLAARGRRRRNDKSRLAAWLAGMNYPLFLLAVIARNELRLAILLLSTGIVAFSFSISFYRLARDAYSLR